MLEIEYKLDLKEKKEIYDLKKDSFLINIDVTNKETKISKKEFCKQDIWLVLHDNETADLIDDERMAFFSLDFEETKEFISNHSKKIKIY
jgi:hypothetical protein